MDVTRVALDIVREVQEAADLEAFRTKVLGRLSEVAPYETALFLSVPGGSTAIGKDPRFLRRYAEEAARYAPDLARGRAAALAQGGAYVDTDVYTAREREVLPFYAELMRPQHITSQLAAHLYMRGRLTAVIHLCRHSGAPFGDDDLARLRPMLPALGLAHGALVLDLEARAPSSPRLAATIAGDDAPPVAELRARLGRLTPQELQVAVRAARGAQTKEIAHALATSPNTVRNQMARIFAKTGVASRTQLALWVQRAGYLGAAA